MSHIVTNKVKPIEKSNIEYLRRSCISRQNPRRTINHQYINRSTLKHEPHKRKKCAVKESKKLLFTKVDKYMRKVKKTNNSFTL